MQETYFDVAITIPMLFTIILCPLLPDLAYSEQQLVFAYPTMIKNQINNIQNKPMSS
jgi:hypothetical protein